jgi:hypothetical protein
MSLDDYVERGLNLMLNSVLTPKGEQVYSQMERLQGGGANSSPTAAGEAQARRARR